MPPDSSGFWFVMSIAPSPLLYLVLVHLAPIDTDLIDDEEVYALKLPLVAEVVLVLGIVDFPDDVGELAEDYGDAFPQELVGDAPREHRLPDAVLSPEKERGEMLLRY